MSGLVENGILPVGAVIISLLVAWIPSILPHSKLILILHRLYQFVFLPILPLYFFSPSQILFLPTFRSQGNISGSFLPENFVFLLHSFSMLPFAGLQFATMLMMLLSLLRLMYPNPYFCLLSYQHYIVPLWVNSFWEITLVLVKVGFISDNILNKY